MTGLKTDLHVPVLAYTCILYIQVGARIPTMADRTQEVYCHDDSVRQGSIIQQYPFPVRPVWSSTSWDHAQQHRFGESSDRNVTYVKNVKYVRNVKYILLRAILKPTRFF